MDSPGGGNRNFLVVDPEANERVMQGLASPVRIRILRLLHARLAICHARFFRCVMLTHARVAGGR